MKVLFMANIPSPYRVDFFNELGKYCELTVTFEGKVATDRNKEWKANRPQNFNAKFMNGIRTKSDQFLCLDVINVINNNFDYIIMGGYSTPTAMLAIEYMRLNNIKFWLEADGGFISKDSVFKYKVKQFFISSASKWLSSGKATTEYLIHYGAKKDNIYEYPFTSIKKNEIAATILSGDEKGDIRKELGMREDKIVLSIGQFIPRKGFDILLRAWKSCPKTAGLYIVGSEPTSEYLDIQNRLKLSNAHFVGFKTKAELNKYYQAADVFVLPTREDIWGLVINEAMAQGLPVITTDRCIAGLELIENGFNGFIVPVEDTNKLSEKITKVLNNDILRITMGNNSLKKIKDYTIEAMAKKHIDVLSESKREC